MSLTAGALVSTGDLRRFRIGTLLKSGGAGSVYPIVDSAEVVVKIYHDGTDLAEYERKVGAMLELSPNLPDIIDGGLRYAQIAWPQALLRDERGQFVGFMMPAIHVEDTSELECILQERQAKAAGLPTGLGAKVTLAANLASVLAELHRQGHHVVDLKPVNVRFYRHALYMAMLDCDGFSIQGRGERFTAQQITPDYLAPEFQNQSIPSLLEEQQDRFALAVMIFQLLNFGVHPFTGRPANDDVPTDIPGRIARRCYAYGLREHPELAPSPVSGHLSMPADLRTLFDRAFAGADTARPRASEWASALALYAQRSSQNLLVCERDPQHQHFAGLPCAQCARAELLALTAKNSPAARTPKWPHRHPATAPVTRAARMAQARPFVSGSGRSSTYVAPSPRRTSFDDWRYLLMAMFCFAALWAGYSLNRSTTNGSPIATITPSSNPPASGYPPLPPPDPVASVRESSTANPVIRQVAESMTQESPYELASLIQAASRREQRQQNRRDADADYSAGIGAIRRSDLVAAYSSFALAIDEDPLRAESWFGYALSVNNDQDATGAFAIAELLASDTSGDGLRARFPYAMRLAAGIDENRFGALEAKGRGIAARVRHTASGAYVAGRANQAPP